jgi:diadenosine tetraphosphate (Ap4A) HIT family hydrolase/5-methylcytosine-specific restriction endonuclease McrA
MKLKEFVLNKMRMSHVYQPVMIKSLLDNKGKLDVEDIAKEILNYDLSQVEYYENITHNMVGKVLRSHNIVSRNKDWYELSEYAKLSKEEKKEIIDICNKKIEAYITKRGIDIWEHRRRNRHPVPGSIRYEVLKRAHYRCELCGISAEEKALEVDHITPKNAGGKDSIHNYQALCYTCNSQKRDLDDTDFREFSHKFKHRDEKCIFCILSDRKIKYENNLAIAIEDKYPVTKHHLLIIPKRHAIDYFELVQAEINAINEILIKAKKDLTKKDSLITGFNIGINNGVDAGQTIFHCHVHLIPRRKNDVIDPTGGIRNIITGNGNYKK